ncbi:vicilin-like seed storage protein At2g18540 [Pecten maximus]|uniref:vicilin-like seed storage protein At2g18540 n=1 Tax=Pecten maximus TaxID=6579 RepID=UPI00145871E8|nr:vicilin-like seed storage protein At2g18540 [Pecten maximus]
MTQDETPSMNMTENVDDAVFKYLSASEMSSDLRNAVMNLFMELFEKEANETVGILGESRLLFKAELTDYHLEQETLKLEARMHEERRQQEELELQQKFRQSKMRSASSMEEEQMGPKIRTLAQIRNERSHSRAQSRNDRSSSSASFRNTDRPLSSMSRQSDRPMSRGRPESKINRPISRAHSDSPRPFSTTASGEPAISQDQLKQESDAILSGMHAAENKQMQEKKRQQEELQKRKEEKIAARNDLQNQAKVILDRAVEVAQANTSNKEKVDLQLQARLDDLKRRKLKLRDDHPEDDDLEEISV